MEFLNKSISSFNLQDQQYLILINLSKTMSLFKFPLYITINSQFNQRLQQFFKLFSYERTSKPSYSYDYKNNQNDNYLNDLKKFIEKATLTFKNYQDIMITSLQLLRDCRWIGKEAITLQSLRQQFKQFVKHATESFQNNDKLIQIRAILKSIIENDIKTGITEDKIKKSSLQIHDKKILEEIAAIKYKLNESFSLSKKVVSSESTDMMRITQLFQSIKFNGIKSLSPNHYESISNKSLRQQTKKFIEYISLNLIDFTREESIFRKFISELAVVSNHQDKLMAIYNTLPIEQKRFINPLFQQFNKFKNQLKNQEEKNKSSPNKSTNELNKIIEKYEIDLKKVSLEKENLIAQKKDLQNQIQTLRLLVSQQVQQNQLNKSAKKKKQIKNYEEENVKIAKIRPSKSQNQLKLIDELQKINRQLNKTKDQYLHSLNQIQQLNQQISFIEKENEEQKRKISRFIKIEDQYNILKNQRQILLKQNDSNKDRLKLIRQLLSSIRSLNKTYLAAFQKKLSQANFDPIDKKILNQMAELKLSNNNLLPQSPSNSEKSIEEKPQKLQRHTKETAPFLRTKQQDPKDVIKALTQQLQSYKAKHKEKVQELKETYQFLDQKNQEIQEKTSLTAQLQRQNNELKESIEKYQQYYTQKQQFINRNSKEKEIISQQLANKSYIIQSSNFEMQKINLELAHLRKQYDLVSSELARVKQQKISLKQTYSAMSIAIKRQHQDAEKRLRINQRKIKANYQEMEKLYEQEKKLYEEAANELIQYKKSMILREEMTTEYQSLKRIYEQLRKNYEKLQNNQGNESISTSKLTNHSNDEQTQLDSNGKEEIASLQEQINMKEMTIQALTQRYQETATIKQQKITQLQILIAQLTNNQGNAIFQNKINIK